MTVDTARALLVAADVFCGPDNEDPTMAQTLNMNDVWGWATAWGEYVPDSELVEVAQLFYSYGWCGILYWMSERHGHMRSEFEDINRFVDFVRQEEALTKEIPNSSSRAYAKRTYTLGSTP